MILLITYSLIAFGITTIITEGNIFQEVRDWVYTKSPKLHEVVTCPLCFSTWLGFILSTILLLTDNVTPSSIFELPDVVTVIIDGFFTAGVVWLLTKIVQDK